MAINWNRPETPQVMRTGGIQNRISPVNNNFSNRMAISQPTNNFRTQTPTYNSIRSKYLASQQPTTMSFSSPQSQRPNYTISDLRQMQRDKGLSKYDDPFKKEGWFKKLFNPLQDKLYDTYNNLIDDSSANKWLTEIEKLNPKKADEIIQKISEGLQTGEFKNPDGSDMRMADGTTVKKYIEDHDAFKASLQMSLNKRYGKETLNAALEDPRFSNDPTFNRAVMKDLKGSVRLTDPLSAGTAIAQKTWLSGLLPGQSDTERSISKATGQFFNPVAFGMTKRNPYYAQFNTMNTGGEKVLGGLSEAAGFFMTAMAMSPYTGKAGAATSKLAPSILGKGSIGQFGQRVAPSMTNAFITAALQDPGGQGFKGFLDPMARVKQGAMASGSMLGGTVVGGTAGRFAQRAGASPFFTKLLQGVSGGTFDTTKAYALGERDPYKLANEFGIGFAYGAKTGQDDIDVLFGKGENVSPDILAARQKLRDGNYEDTPGIKSEEFTIGGRGLFGDTENIYNARLNYITQQMNASPEVKAAAFAELMAKTPDSEPLKQTMPTTAKFSGIEYNPEALFRDATKFGETEYRTQDVVTQRGADEVTRMFTDEVLKGTDPQTAWSRAAKFSNQEFGTNIPLKLPTEFKADDLPDFLDPTVKVDKLELPDEIKLQAKQIQNEFKKIALEEVDNMQGFKVRPETDMLPWEGGGSTIKEIYHNSTKPVAEFSLDKAGEVNNFGKAVYFYDNAEAGSRFGNNQTSVKIPTTEILDLNKPIDVNTASKILTPELAKDVYGRMGEEVTGQTIWNVAYTQKLDSGISESKAYQAVAQDFQNAGIKGVSQTTGSGTEYAIYDTKLLNDSFKRQSPKINPQQYPTVEEYIKAHGEPLLHGTTKQFEEFDIAQAGTRNPADQGFAGKGIYLTNSKEVAETFAKNEDIFKAGDSGKGRIVESYIDIPEGRILQVNDFTELSQKLGLPLSNNRPQGVGLTDFIKEQAPIIRDTAQNMGYDAIKVDGGGTDKYGTQAYEMVVFDPTKIKTKEQLIKTYNTSRSGDIRGEGNVLGGDTQKYNDLETVRKAINNGYEPKNSRAKALYDEVINNATQRLGSEDLWKTTGMQDASSKIDEYFYNQKIQKYDLANLKNYIDQSGKPFETIKQTNLVQDKVNSLTNLEDLTVNKSYSNSKWDEFKTDLQNRAAPIEDLGESAKAAVRKVYGSDGIAVAKIFEELQKPVFENNGIELGEDYDNFVKYVVQKRNANLETQGLKGASEIYYPKDSVFGSEKTLAIPTDPITDPRYEAAFQELTKFQHASLDYAAQSGLIRPETAEALKQSGDYVRFERVFDDTDITGFSGGGKVGSLAEQTFVQKYKGSDRAIYDPIEATVRQSLKLEKQAQMNDATMVTIRSMQEIPELADLVQRVDAPSGLKSNEYLTVLVNGEKQYYKAPPEIVEAAKNLPNQQMGQLVQIAAAPSKWLRYGATSGNVNFLIPNILRDQFNAGINTQYGYRPFVDYFSGLKSLVTKDDSYRAWQKSGAEIFTENDPGKIVEQLVPKGTESEFVSKVKSVSNPLAWIRKLGEYSEVPTRIGLYKRAIESGATPDQAMLESRSATSDFAVRGAKTKEVSAIIPFLNARVQGFDSTVQAFKRNPGRASFYTAAYAVLPSIILQAAIEQTPVYNQLSDYDKDKYYIIPIKGSNSVNPEDFIKVPKPQIAQWLNPLRKDYELSKQGYDTNVGNLGLDIASEINPIGGFKVDQRAGQFKPNLGEWMPQIIKPAFEVQANYDSFRDRPILSDSQQLLPAGYQANSSTDPFFREVGAQLGISPAQLQHLAYGYSGGLGKDIASGVGRLTGINDNYPARVKEGAPRGSQVPIVNRLWGVDLNTSGEQSTQMNFAVRDINERRKAIIRSPYIPERVKQQQLQDLDFELKMLEQRFSGAQPMQLNMQPMNVQAMGYQPGMYSQIRANMRY